MRRRLCCQGAAAAQARQQRPPRSSCRPYSPGRAELWVPAPHRKSRSAPHWRSERHTTGRTLRRLPDRVPAPHRKSRSAPHWRSERHTTGRTLRRLPDLRRSTVALQKTFHLQKRLHRVRLWCSNESPRFFLEEEKRKKRKVCGLRSSESTRDEPVLLRQPQRIELRFSRRLAERGADAVTDAPWQASHGARCRRAQCLWIGISYCGIWDQVDTARCGRDRWVHQCRPIGKSNA